MCTITSLENFICMWNAIYVTHSSDRFNELPDLHTTQVLAFELHAWVVTEWPPTCLHKLLPIGCQKGSWRKPRMSEVSNLIIIYLKNALKVLGLDGWFWRQIKNHCWYFLNSFMVLHHCHCHCYCHCCCCGCCCCYNTPKQSLPIKITITLLISLCPCHKSALKNIEMKEILFSRSVLKTQRSIVFILIMKTMSSRENIYLALISAAQIDFHSHKL